MKNHLVDWSLYRVADCAVIDKETRDVAKSAADTLINIRNMLGVSPMAEPKDIEAAIYKLLNP